MAQLVFKQLVGNLPTSEYDPVEDGKKIGFIQIRHKPSHAPTAPPHMASHIYYEIDPAFRGKGYGKLILKSGLEEARKIGLQELLITCDDENIASKKIIEANGGIFIEKALLPKNKTMLKYSIPLSGRVDSLPLKTK